MGLLLALRRGLYGTETTVSSDVEDRQKHDERRREDTRWYAAQNHKAYHRAYQELLYIQRWEYREQQWLSRKLAELEAQYPACDRDWDGHPVSQPWCAFSLNNEVSYGNC
jgi:hypothetical protein